MLLAVSWPRHVVPVPLLLPFEIIQVFVFAIGQGCARSLRYESNFQIFGDLRLAVEPVICTGPHSKAPEAGPSQQFNTSFCSFGFGVERVGGGGRDQDVGLQY